MTADYLIYECHACGDYRVPVELIQGEWVVTGEERCPACGQYGRDLEGEDPDAYWQANERAEERCEAGEETLEEWYAELWSEYQAAAR